MNLTRYGIDLHAHTTASDGSDSPAELVRKAAALGLAAIAVTDHDTVSGLAAAAVEAVAVGIEFVPGVELSVEDERGRFHLLGYLFDPANAKLAETLITLRASRAERNRRMALKMTELGLAVTMDDVLAEAGDGGEVVARPHFARALMKKGIVSSVQEAFDRFLATGKPLYLPKEGLTPRDAIALLHKAGGIGVVAHPGLIPMGDDALAARIASLASEAGLDGLEVYYSQHSPLQTERFARIAEANGLVMTGGSDYHGLAKPHVPLGVVTAGAPAREVLLDRMRERCDAIRQRANRDQAI